MIAPITGMMMSFTSDVTMAPNATPMMTPTARSTTFPRIMNFLNSSNICASFLSEVSHDSYPGSVTYDAH